MEKMLSADTDFVMGKVLTHVLTLLGTGDSGRKNPKILEELKSLREAAEVSETVYANFLIICAETLQIDVCGFGNMIER